MPDSDTRDDLGRWVQESGVTPQDVLDVMEPVEPYGTGELAEAVGIPRRTAYNYLSELAEAGRVDKKKLDARRCVWIKL